MKVAVVQYRLDALSGWAAFADKLDAMVGASCRAGAELVAFPDHAGLELASLLPPGEALDTAGLTAALQSLVPEYLDVYARVARQHGCMVVAGSLPVQRDGACRDRVHVFGPTGLIGVQDKLAAPVSDGGVVTVFQAPFGRFAVAVGEDIEVPSVVGAMARAGARLVVHPTGAATPAEANRARLSARARAAENRLFVAQAPLVGGCGNFGTAAIFTPMGDGFPSDGLLAQAVSDGPQVVLGEVDFALIDRTPRVDGAEAAPFTVEVVGVE